MRRQSNVLTNKNNHREQKRLGSRAATVHQMVGVRPRTIHQLQSGSKCKNKGVALTWLHTQVQLSSSTSSCQTRPSKKKNKKTEAHEKLFICTSSLTTQTNVNQQFVGIAEEKSQRKENARHPNTWRAYQAASGTHGTLYLPTGKEQSHEGCCNNFELHQTFGEKSPDVVT